jgi:hypothetical protein
MLASLLWILRFKRLLFLTLVTALLFALTGCLGLGDGASRDNANNSEVMVMEPPAASPADNNDSNIGVTGATLQIRLGTDEILSRYESFAESFYEDEADGE